MEEDLFVANYAAGLVFSLLGVIGLIVATVISPSNESLTTL